MATPKLSLPPIAGPICGIDIGGKSFSYATVMAMRSDSPDTIIFQVTDVVTRPFVLPEGYDLIEWMNFARRVCTHALPNIPTAIEIQLYYATRNFFFYRALQTTHKHYFPDRFCRPVHADDISVHFNFARSRGKKSLRYDTKKEAAVAKIQELVQRQRLVFATPELYERLLENQNIRDMSDAILIAIYALYRCLGMARTRRQRKGIDMDNDNHHIPVKYGGIGGAKKQPAKGRAAKTTKVSSPRVKRGRKIAAPVDIPPVLDSQEKGVEEEVVVDDTPISPLHEMPDVPAKKKRTTTKRATRKPRAPVNKGTKKKSVSATSRVVKKKTTTPRRTKKTKTAV